MPSLYAHLRFGEDALPSFTPQQQALLQAQRASYDLGLLGPDLFFNTPSSIYKILRHTADFGSQLHKLSFRENLQRIMLNDAPERFEAGVLAYYYGYLGHFLLDAHAHPTVDRFTHNTTEHFRLERHFDEALAFERGEEIWKLRLYRRLDPATAPVLDLAYRNFPEAGAGAAVRWMRRLRRMTYTPTKFSAGLLLGLIKRLSPALREVCYGPVDFIDFSRPELSELRRNYEAGLAVYPASLNLLETLLRDPQRRDNAAGTNTCDAELPALFELDFSGQSPDFSARREADKEA